MSDTDMLAFQPTTTTLQPRTNAPALFQQVLENHQALVLRPFDLELLEVIELNGLHAGRGENRTRVTGSGRAVREERLPDGTLHVLDGQYHWAYVPQRREYSKQPSTLTEPLALRALQLFAVRRESARFLRHESITVQAGAVPCVVIEVDRRPAAGLPKPTPVTYWIDSRRNLIVQARYVCPVTRLSSNADPVTTVTVSILKVRMGAAVDQSRLRFVPPLGSTQVDRLTFQAKSRLTGLQASEFQLQGADGSTITAESLRGRPTLLYFGSLADDDATLLLEMMHQALNAKGLTALCVVDSHDDIPSRWSFSVATDPGRAAAKKFGFDARGTVLLNAAGRIVYADGAGGNAHDLTEALRSVGLL